MDYKERESCIRAIRARLPYLAVRELNLLKAFLDGLQPARRLSTAEYNRPVLTPDKQTEADGEAQSEDFNSVTGVNPCA